MSVQSCSADGTGAFIRLFCRVCAFDIGKQWLSLWFLIGDAWAGLKVTLMPLINFSTIQTRPTSSFQVKDNSRCSWSPPHHHSRNGIAAWSVSPFVNVEPGSGIGILLCSTACTQINTNLRRSFSHVYLASFVYIQSPNSARLRLRESWDRFPELAWGAL